MRGKSLAEIAAFQWSASNQIVIDDLSSLPEQRWTSVTYQALVNDPQTTLTRICRFAGIESAAVKVDKDELPLSPTTVSPPHPEKWKKYEQEIDVLWPVLSETVQNIKRVCADRS